MSEFVGPPQEWKIGRNEEAALRLQIQDAIANPLDRVECIRYEIGDLETPRVVTLGNLTLTRGKRFCDLVRMEMTSSWGPVRYLPEIEADIFKYGSKQSIFDHELAHLRKVHELARDKMKKSVITCYFLDESLDTIPKQLSMGMSVRHPVINDPFIDMQIIIAPENLSVNDCVQLEVLFAKHRSELESRDGFVEMISAEYLRKTGIDLLSPRHF
ncbi:MAG: hypothetical protein RLZZ455_170 [Candidatus Parcubacteria bacterium]|jgi:hypothetical protein